MTSNPLTGSDIVRIVDEVGKAIKLLVDLPDNPRPESKGGYLSIFSGKTGVLLFSVLIGEVPPEKVEKYSNLSREKAQRLLKNPGHLSSWQTRNPEEDKYGGAIRVILETGQEFIFSISGFPEVGDETVVLVSAISTLGFNAKRAEEIAKISGNDLFNHLYKVIYTSRFP
jgi:hypothetical protein